MTEPTLEAPLQQVKPASSPWVEVPHCLPDGWPALLPAVPCSPQPLWFPLRLDTRGTVLPALGCPFSARTPPCLSPLGLACLRASPPPGQDWAGGEETQEPGLGRQLASLGGLAVPAERLALQEGDAKQARGQVWTRSAVSARVHAGDRNHGGLLLQERRCRRKACWWG